MKKSKTKKLLVALLCTTMLAAGCGSIAACKQPDSGNTGDTDKKYTLDLSGVYAYAQEAGYTGTYEELLTAVKGEKGKDGLSVKGVELDADGYLVFTLSDGSTAKTDKAIKDGINGNDGASVTGASLDEEGYIVFTLSDGTTVKTDKAIKDGKDGANGENGTDGKDGVSVTGVDFDEEGHLVLTLSDGTTTSTDKAIKDGKDGENGADGASVKSVTVDGDGYLVFTLTNGATTKTDKTLLEILAMQPNVCKVYYHGFNGEGVFDIEDVYGDLRFDSVNYGDFLFDPLESKKGDELEAFIEDIDYAFGEGTITYKTWYYRNGDGQFVKYQFGQKVYGELHLYAIAEGEKDYNVGFAGFEGATVYGSYDGIEKYKTGDVLPSIAAYKRFTEGEGEEAVEKLSIFIGWAVNGKLAEDNVIKETGDIEVTPVWKTVDYGYISEGLILGADGVVSTVNASGTNDTTTGNTSIYGNTAADKSALDDIVIISGDNVTALTTGKYFQGNGTTGVKVKGVYIIAPNLIKVVAPGNHNTVQTGATSLVGFQSMPECETVIIAADKFQQFGSIFKNSPKLKFAALDYTMVNNTNTANPVNYFELRGSTFSGCTALEVVHLKTQVTVFGSYEFENCYTFDVVNNFGWDYLNKLTSVGYLCFKANETFGDELIIDGDHFKALAWGTTLNQMFSSDTNYGSTRNNQSFKSVRIEMFGSFAFSMTMLNLSKELESVELYLPNATSVTINTENCPVKYLRVYAPKATAINSGSLKGTQIESLYVTSDKTYKGNEDAILVVGKATATGSFSECTNLKTAEFDVPTIETVSGNLFSGSKNLTRVEFKSGDIRVFGSSAFYCCNKLRAVIWPDLDATDTRMYRSSGTETSPSYTYIQNVFADCYDLEYLSNYNHFEKMLAVADMTLTMGHGFPKEAKVFTQSSENGFYFCGGTLFRYDESALPANGAVVIPAKTTAIAQNAFKGMAIKSVSFANNCNLVTLGNSAFANCEELTTVNMTNATKLECDYTGYGTNYNTYWFQNCTALTTVTLPESEGFTTLGGSMFENCPALTSLTIPANVTKIMDSVFINHSNMQNLTFAGTSPQLTEIGGSLFNGGDNLNATAILAAICNATIRPTQEGAEFITPSNLFYNCKSITSVEIPAAYEAFGYRTFDGCSSLSSVTFAAGTQIKYLNTYKSSPTSTSRSSSYAFNGTAISSFTVPESAIESPELNLASLTSITFENGCPNLQEIGSLNKSNITSLIVPANVVKIGSLADCEQLASITFTNGCPNLVSMGSFSNCKALTSITIPANYGAPDTRTNPKNTSHNNLPTFSGCEKLESITFENGCPELQKFGGTFQNCKALKSIIIPENVNALTAYLFRDCTSLESVIFASNENITGSAVNYLFYGCTALTKVTVMVPKAGGAEGEMEEIGYNTLPKSYKSTGSYVFQNCSSLKNFTFQKPASGNVTIGSDAFNGCSSLEWISVPSDTSYGNATTFSGCNKLSTVIITAGNTNTVNNGGTTAYKTNTYTYTPWYQRAKATDINIVIGNGVTAFGNYSMYLSTAEQSAMKPRYHFYFEGNSALAVGSYNNGYDGSTNVTTGKGTGWDYEYGTMNPTTDSTKWTAPEDTTV